MRTYLHAGSIAAATLLAFANTSALAQAYDCDKYARDAVAAHKFSQERYCNFRGNEWSDHYINHRDWCRRSQYSIRQSVGSQRKAAPRENEG